MGSVVSVRGRPPLLPRRRKCLLVRKGSVFPSGGGGIKAARDQSGIGGAIRWAHNASMPTPFLLLSPPPLLRVSRLSRKWRKLFIVVHFLRGWRKRKSQSMRILFVSNVFQLGFSSINLILPLLYLSLDGVQSDKSLQRFWED